MIINLLIVTNVHSEESEIEKTIELLNEGEQKILLPEKYKNLVLFVGTTGTGKTTLVQWLAGNNDDLIAKRVGADNKAEDYDITDYDDDDNFIIENKANSIGSSSMSKTIFPELFIEN